MDFKLYMVFSFLDEDWYCNDCMNLFNFMDFFFEVLFGFDGFDVFVNEES